MKSALYTLKSMSSTLRIKQTDYRLQNCIVFLDELRIPVRSQDRYFRAVINDIYKSSTSALSVSIKIEAGFIENGEKVYIMPNADPVIVKGIVIIRFLRPSSLRSI